MRTLDLLVAVAALGALVWLGMGVSTATLLRRAGAPAGRAWSAGLLAWPLVQRRLRRDDRDHPGDRDP